MELSAKEYQHLVQEIAHETGAKRDGTGKNLIVPRCPFCGKSGGNFGIYIGQATTRREPFMAHCFSCGKSTRTLEQLLEAIGRIDLMVAPTTDITAPLRFVLGFEPDDNFTKERSRRWSMPKTCSHALHSSICAVESCR